MQGRARARHGLGSMQQADTFLATRLRAKDKGQLVKRARRACCVFTA